LESSINGGFLRERERDGIFGISLSFSFSVKKLLKLTVGTDDDVAQFRLERHVVSHSRYKLLDFFFFFIQTDPMG